MGYSLFSTSNPTSTLAVVDTKCDFRSENDKLKNQLKKKDEDLSSARAAIDRFTTAVNIPWIFVACLNRISIFFFSLQTTKNALSELEKREKRAMERKISELEEELKVIETANSIRLLYLFL